MAPSARCGSTWRDGTVSTSGSRRLSASRAGGSTNTSGGNWIAMRSNEIRVSGSSAGGGGGTTNGTGTGRRASTAGGGVAATGAGAGIGTGATGSGCRATRSNGAGPGSKLGEVSWSTASQFGGRRR